MSKVSKIIATFLVFAIIILGIKDFTSLNWFIKPLAWQILYGYSQNEVPDDAGVQDRIKSVTTSIEKIFADTEQKYAYTTINGLFHKILGKKVVEDAVEENKVVKLNNGYLTFINPRKDISSYAKKITALKEYSQEQNAEFVYVQPPFKISKYEPMLPAGVFDYTNETLDSLLSALKKNEVECIDLREEMHNQGLDQYEYFFTTDLHWTTEAGFWASKTIATLLADKYDFTLNETALNLDNYDIEVYEDIFLGTHGRRVGKYYAGTDDFSVITPKFKTDFDFESPFKELSASGSFEDTFIYKSHLDKDNLFTSDPYSTYTHGGHPLAITQNHISPNDKKVLIIRDSFSTVIYPFLALNCKELHAIDLRGYTKSLAEYIKEFKPDVVLLIYNPTMFYNNDIMFDF